MRTLVAVVVSSVALTAGLPAQQMPDGSANKAAIERLRFMEGTWRGEGWMQRGPGERISATVTETVERRLEGVALLVTGRGMSGDRIVHDALGVIYWDAAASRYVLRSWVASGFWGDFPVELIDGGVSWSREVPGGRVRYVARISGTEWHETGEFSRDGTTWMPVLEMRLRRQP